MDYDEIFEQYYNLYRTEADTPNSADDEYKVGIRLANEAINRWSSYDSTYWKELFTTFQTTDQGSTVLALNTTTYDAPDDMREAGGFVRVLNAVGNTIHRYQILEPQDVQFRGDNSNYCYFTGDPNNGFVLHLNPNPTTNIVGLRLDYVYYKKPATISTGSDTPEMNDPYFIVHRMLAQRFRASRNPYYASAKADAEDVLKTMKINNDSGNWANPWKIPDRSGTIWGESWGV